MLCQASKLLTTGLKGGLDGMSHIAKRMESLERAGDDVTHKLFERLRATFITPFDPEDIQSLASALDTILDSIEDSTFRIVAYRIDPIPHEMVELGELIAGSCAALNRALQALHQKKSVLDACIEVNRFEEQADAIERTMLINIFSSSLDAVSLIKLKDLYEALEGTTDRCEDAADVIQNIAVKNL